MHVALAHDYLTQRGGAERVVLAMTRIFGSATLYTALYNPNQTFPEFRDKDLRTSPLQHVAPFRRDPRLALPLLPAAWRATRVTDADVVLASTSGWAHGVRVGPDTAKVAYCHNPARWLYQTDAYLQGPAARAALRPFLPALQRWDRNAAAGVDLR